MGRFLRLVYRNCKIRLQGDDEKAKDTAKSVLVYVLTDILKLLHPFMPFITEEIYQAIPHDCESIMISKWVEYDENLCFAENEAKMEILMSAIRAIRNRRAEMNIPPSKKLRFMLKLRKQNFSLPVLTLLNVLLLQMMLRLNQALTISAIP